MQAPGKSSTDIGPSGPRPADATTQRLLNTERVEVVRLVMPAGKEIPAHQARGALLVHCLGGRVSFTTMGKTVELEAGQLIYPTTGERHALRAVDDASLMLTIVPER